MHIGCGKAQDKAAAPSTSNKPTIALVMKSLANEFFKQMQAGAEAYAAKNKDKFDFAAVGLGRRSEPSA